MLPIIQKPPLTSGQKKTALAIAGTIDLLQLAVFPAIGLGVVLDEALDVVAAILLTAVCGFKWQFALAFAFELLPIADLMPTWTAVVLLLGSTSAPVQASQTATAAAVPPLPPQTPPARPDGMVDVQAVAVPPIQRQTLPSQ